MLTQHRLPPRLAALCLLAAAAARAGDWTFYRHDVLGNANAGEPLTASDARALQQTRSFRGGGDIYSNPIVAGGSLYYVAGDSFIHAIDLSTMTERWRKKISINGPFHCTGMGRADPVGAPAVIGTTVYVPGGDGVVYALDAATGQVIWQTQVADVPNLGEFLWSSIFPLNGRVYVGVSSLIDCLLVPGRLVALDQATGALAGTWWADKSHGPGGGIWTQQAFDAASGRLFATTGTIANGQTSTTQPWADAFVAIDPASMTALDSFSPVPNDTFQADADFGAGPTLYDSPAGQRFVAATDKNGWVYALDRDHLAAGIVWQYRISAPGASPDFGESSIVSAPYANGTLFVGGGKTVDGFPGAIAALDAFTGAQKWLFHPDGYVLAGMTVTGGVLFAAASQGIYGNGTLYALDQATGEVLYTLTAARMFGEPTWANGALYVGDATGALFEVKPNPAGPQPDFDLVMGPLVSTGVAGGSATFSVTVKPKNGFNADVALSATRLPTAQVNASFSPATVTATGASPYSSTLTLSTDPSIPAIYDLAVISGSGGGLTRTAAGWLVMQNFSLKATPMTVVQGRSATSTITVAGQNGFSDPVSFSASGLPAGATASFNPASATGSTVLTVTTSGSTPPGSYQLQVTGASGALAHAVTVPLVVTQPADFQVAITPASQEARAGGQAVYTVSVARTGGFSDAVTFSATGLPTGATAAFSAAADPAVRSLTVSLPADTPAGPWVFSVLVSGGGLTHTASAALTVLQPPDFDLAVASPSLTVVQGASITVAVSVSPRNGFAGAVALDVPSLPAGLVAAWDPPQTASASTLTISAAQAAAPGTYSLSLSGSGAGLTRTASLSVEVSGPDGQTPPVVTSRSGCTSSGAPGAGGSLLGVLLVLRARSRRRRSTAAR